jgi:hypothetical protein
MIKVNVGDVFGCMTVKSIEKEKCTVTCNCGLSKSVLKTNLTTGRTKSLGCLKKSAAIHIEPIILGDKLFDRFNESCLELGFPQVESLPPKESTEIPHWILTNLFFYKPYNLKTIFGRGSLAKDFPKYRELIDHLVDNSPDTTDDVLLDKFYLYRSRIIKRLLF